jgi:hypothetical protein
MTSGHRTSGSATRPTSAHTLAPVPSVVLGTTRPTTREAAHMRTTTLYLEDSPATVSRMSAPVPDPKPGHPSGALGAAREAATEAAWDAFERATFPDLTR